MALFALSDLLSGTKRFFVGLQGLKSDGTTMENLKTNDAGALKVSAELTGSIVDTVIVRKVETVIARAVRSANASLDVTVPNGAKGAIVITHVYSATGTTPTTTMRVINKANGVTGSFGATITSGNIAAGRQSQIYIGSGVSSGSATATLGEILFAPILLTSKLGLLLAIGGTFAGGEGVDCVSEIFWIY